MMTSDVAQALLNLLVSARTLGQRASIHCEIMKGVADLELRNAGLEGAIECACDFLDALQKETGVGAGTASMLRTALGHKEVTR